MKSAEFKKILKPLIKQTIKEVILEEGILSGIVSEVVKGMNSNILESKSEANNGQLQKQEKYELDRQERIKRLNESTNIKTNVFEGTREISDSHDVNPLSGTPSGDSGVDISGILDLAKGKWKQLV